MNEVNIEIKSSSDLSTISVISNIKELKWVRRYKEVGEFSFTAYCSQDDIGIFETGNLVMRSDRDEVMIITSVKISRTEDGYIEIKVSGKDFLFYLAKRIATCDIGESEYATGFIFLDELIEAYVFGNAFNDSIGSTNPSLPTYRQINKQYAVDFDSDGIPEKKVYKPRKYCTVFDAVNNALGVYDIRLAASYDGELSHPRIRLYLIPKTDKTDSLIFSDSLENLKSWRYSQAIDDYANVCVVTGDTTSFESEEFRTTVVSGYGYGPNRLEDLLESSTEKGEMSAANYRTALYTEGLQEIATSTIQFKFDAETDNSIFTYPDDYDLGDVATIETSVISGEGTIIEITEIFDSTGYSVFPTFEISQQFEIITEDENAITTEDGKGLKATGEAYAD